MKQGLQRTELTAWKRETWILSSVFPHSTSGDFEGFQYPPSVRTFLIWKGRIQQWQWLVGANIYAKVTLTSPECSSWVWRRQGLAEARENLLTLQYLLLHADTNRHLLSGKRWWSHWHWDYYGNNHSDTDPGKTHPWEMPASGSKPECNALE